MILLCRTLNQAAPGHSCREGRRGGGAPDLCVSPSISGALHKTRLKIIWCFNYILNQTKLILVKKTIDDLPAVATNHPTPVDKLSCKWLFVHSLSLINGLGFQRDFTRGDVPRGWGQQTIVIPGLQSGQKLMRKCRIKATFGNLIKTRIRYFQDGRTGLNKLTKMSLRVISEGYWGQRVSVIDQGISADRDNAI
ncbi:hypothetical protein CEXT_428291 [Caerostris extrusa]|uniref:Uncharacterized protein n=1 Tax=Caerostris extrusa TaxID=172846 RepID=A0AAV4X928_CAEEX|nr:hypothetical protein CEXT_428291 [Caerostris extrusa]